MITSFEVGAILKIIDQASPALTRILRQVRELQVTVDKARASLAELTKGIGTGASLTTAIGETKALATEWKSVADNAAKARVAMTAAASGPGVTGATLGGNRGLFRPGARVAAAGGAHISGPSVAVPGGSHLRFGGPAMAAAATFGWGLDQAAKTEDYTWKLEDISGLPHDEPTHAKFRKLLQDFQIKSGYGIDEAGKAALANIRLFQGAPGGGVDTLAEILDAGSVEARRKGTSLEESVEAGIGLAHQFRAYTPEAIRKLMQTFAALSTADPRSLSGMKRAAGYSVPTLAQIGVDESSVLLAGTALAGAGVDSTKSGTWIREAVTRAMPGIVLGHRASNRKHEEALRRFHLTDESGKPTWFGADGKPDMFKMFSITSDALQGMTPQDRAAYGRAAFGAQGFGAISVLGDPAVNARMRQIADTTKSQAYTDRYNSFGKDYLAGSTMQDFRTAMQDFNVTTGEIARVTLPTVNRELGDLKGILDGIRSIIPHAPDPAAGDKGSRDLMGEAVTGAMGLAKRFWDSLKSGAGIDPGGSFTSPGKTGKPAQPKAQLAPITLNLNLDGRTLGTAMSEIMADIFKFSTEAPAADGIGLYDGGGE